MISVEFGLRILGMVGFAVLGWFGGETLAPYIDTGVIFTAVTLAAVKGAPRSLKSGKVDIQVRGACNDCG